MESSNKGIGKKVIENQHRISIESGIPKDIVIHN